ncbi:cytochrome P450 [Xylaria palmicola]|nr:cytochrome P450 [Xylaria palmicola]
MLSTTAFSVVERLTWVQICLGLGGLAVLWYIVGAIVAWNKLRHIPGPFLASFSYVWAFWVAYSGRSHIILDSEQKKHGPVIRIAPDGVTIIDAESFNEINSARSSYTRGGWYKSTRFDYRGPSIICVLDVSYHAKRKSKLATAFSSKNLTTLESGIDKWIGALVHSLHAKLAKGQETMDLGQLVQYFQVDLIAELGMGQPWNDLEEERDNFGYLEMSDSVVPAVQCFAFLPLARALYTSMWFMKLFGPKTTDSKGVGRFMGVLQNEVESRFNDTTDKYTEHHDILGTWIKNGLTAEECQLDLSLLIPAGSETTIMMIRGTLLLLMSSPIMYQKLKQEIRNGIATGRISSPVTNEEAKSLEYTQAVIREGLRLMAPANFGFPKRVPPEGDTICGVYLPGGTEVYANYHSMMRNKEVFGDDAETFRPERFIGGGPDIAHMIKAVDLIFGGGRYMCLGKIVALLEMNKIFVELFRNFDFQIANPEKPWERLSYTTWMVYDFWVRVTKDTTMA